MHKTGKGFEPNVTFHRYDFNLNITFRIFKDGMSLETITALLYASFCLLKAMTERLGLKLEDVVMEIASYIVRIFKDRIARWIACHIGWGSSMRYSVTPV
ncbi:hypothetical protein DPMN_070757 [Dreissena polymorpha]|uniref:Uncharacterized protein n=1 Tax=Dreissena polymorpha TaxID=45954 RepID=A0A9D3Z1K7_DREPO|nr:hypothetical protein DPMN_070757 [Dreissena polymorpha]